MSASYIEIPQPLGLFARDLYDRGLEYLDAFEVLGTHAADGEFQFARYYLFAHSLELLLKSFLAAKEVTKRVIRYDLGHDLPSIMALCKHHSIPTVSNLEVFVAHTHEMNRDYDFRYPSGYNLSMPKPVECASLARQLAAAIALEVRRAEVRATLRVASDTRQYRGKKKIRWSD